MASAMMAPIAAPAARYVALAGRADRRVRGPALFLAAYVAAWTAVGAGHDAGGRGRRRRSPGRSDARSWSAAMAVAWQPIRPQAADAGAMRPSRADGREGLAGGCGLRRFGLPVRSSLHRRLRRVDGDRHRERSRASRGRGGVRAAGSRAPGSPVRRPVRGPDARRPRPRGRRHVGRMVRVTASAAGVAVGGSTFVCRIGPVTIEIGGPGGE